MTEQEELLGGGWIIKPNHIERTVIVSAKGFNEIKEKLSKETMGKLLFKYKKALADQANRSEKEICYELIDEIERSPNKRWSDVKAIIKRYFRVEE